MKRTRLLRRTPLKRTGFKRRGGRLPYYSAVGRMQADAYRRQRVKHLQEHPFCEVRWRNGKLAHRHDFTAKACGRRACQIHHIRRRGRRYLLDRRYWLSTCAGRCHGYIEAHGREAVAMGYLERINPATGQPLGAEQG